MSSNVYIDGVRYAPVQRTDVGKLELLDFVFPCDDLGRDVSIREFLHALLDRVWGQGESFSGKRPFGNSGWEHYLYTALALAGAVKSTNTLQMRASPNDPDYQFEFADLDDENIVAANAIIYSLIAKMCGVPTERS